MVYQEQCAQVEITNGMGQGMLCSEDQQDELTVTGGGNLWFYEPLQLICERITQSRGDSAKLRSRRLNESGQTLSGSLMYLVFLLVQLCSPEDA